jgi:hypothetical protein
VSQALCAFGRARFTVERGRHRKNLQFLRNDFAASAENRSERETIVFYYGERPWDDRYDTKILTEFTF